MDQSGNKICPVCAEEIRAAAKMCRFCGAVLTDEQLPQIIPIRTQSIPAIPSVSRETIEEIRRTTVDEFRRRGVALSDSAWNRIERIFSRAEDQYYEATALVIDVCGFKQMAERAPTEEIRARLEHLYDLCAHQVSLHNGFIAKFIGDAVLAIFGAPMASDRDPESAVLAALEIRDAARLLAPLGGRPLRIRAGIDTGTVISTVVRTPRRADFSVLGEAVDIAQRLQAQADPDGVLVSAATCRHLGQQFEIEPAGVLTLKNIGEPVEASCVIRKREGAQVRREYSTPFVGREDELAQMRRHVEAVKTGTGARFVAVYGKPGVGKSRLVWEAVQSSGQDIAVLQAECSQHGAPVPFGAVIELLRRAFVLPADAPNEMVEERITRYFAENPLIEPEQIAYLHYLFMLPAAIEQYAQVPAQSLHCSIQATLVTFVRGLLARGPLVLFVDDLQWIDPSSAEFLATLKRTADLSGLLVVAAYRDAERLPGGIEAHFETIEPAPLAEPERLELLSWLVNREPLGTEIRDAVLRKEGGNPLYLEETAQAILRYWEEADAEEAPESIARIEDVIPDSLRGIIQTRVDALEHRTRLLLQCAAILGPRCAISVLGLLEMIRDGLLSRLHLLCGLDFLQEQPTADDMEFIFRHGLSQEVAYQSLSEQQRSELHGLIARQLEKKFEETETLDQHCSVLAYHYLRSDQREQALHWTMQSARRASRMFAGEEALNLYEQSIVVLEEMHQTESHRRQMAEVLRERGRLLRFAGNLDEADESFDALLAVADDLGDDLIRANALAGLALNLYQRGRFDESDTQLRRALDLYEEVADRPGLAMVYNALGMNRLGAGDAERALEWFERGERLDIADERPAIAADIHNNRGLALWRRQQYEPALESIGKGHTIWRHIHNDFGLCATTLNMGILEENLGRLSSALENYESALHLARRLLYREAETMILINTGNALRRGRDLVHASEKNSMALETARQMERADLEAAALENLGLDAIAAGRPAEARSYFDLATGAVGPGGDPERRASLSLDLVRACLAVDEADRGRAHFDNAVGLIEDNDLVSLRVPRLLAQALLASHSGAPETHSLFEQAADVARQVGNPWEELDALETWAAHCERAGDTERRDAVTTRLARLRKRLK